ncbi:MAG: hypothetical protein IRZ16_08825 [Myxococcaceae bacterium]|nr:hypothetical protein [Myxococcaceae bacterium]
MVRRHRNTARIVAIAALAGLAFSCATLTPPRPTLTAGVIRDARSLAAAVEAFYSARSPEELRTAAESALAAAPSSGQAQELAAQLARLEMREGDEFEALCSAARDTGYDATIPALMRLAEMSRTDAQDQRFIALLAELSESHPDPRVRAWAAFELADHLHAEGDDAGAALAVSRVDGALPLAVVGGWDNDQGKGFDVVYPPEGGVDLSATYDGALMKIGWVRQPPRDVRGETELRDFLAPESWSVAYAASGFTVPETGEYEVRVASTDPLKIFVDGTEVFEAREVERVFGLDQFVVPLRLDAGVHQLLIKSAHRTGDWRLFARVTGAAGAKVAVGAVEAGPVAHALPGRSPLGEDGALDAAVAHMAQSPARQAHWRAFGAARAFGGSVSVRAAQAFAREYPGAILARDALIDALWDNGERGRTADELAQLDREVGEALPLIHKQQARFWLQEGLRQRARKELIALVVKYPDRPAPQRQLAELFGVEKWIEDKCRTLEALDASQPHTLDFQMDLAECWLSERRDDKAIALYRDLLGHHPHHYGLMLQLHGALREGGHLDEAAQVAREWLQAYPEKLFPRMKLAETLRRAGKDEAAEEVLEEANALFPNSADVLRAMAALAWRRGEKDKAIAAWQAALVRNPDDDDTANRLDFVAPAQMGPWAKDIPSDEQIQQAVRLRQTVQQEPGADLAFLLDHEVTELRPDGSTTNVVTNVVYAFNQQGRDRLTRQHLAYGGRVRVLQAYSIDANGRRSEASVRSREVLFRGLDVGSTIVLQYRADVPPSGFLPRYLSKSWSFQSVNDQRSLAQFVLWYPVGNTLHEHKVGDLVREETRVGDQIRVSWKMENTRPIIAEPHMPNLIEIAANLQLTTIPGWDAYKKWEEALLESAFRDSPDLDELAQRLAEGAKTPEEKLLRIHQFVMEQIRYQQDYESFIAGVKPHPASMVVERRYGDCKDKSVLFITLARKLGLKAHFATVRTRDRGQVMKDLPTQQFNHAIVYVPPQPGLPEGRFYDATADALDLDVLRDDDAGTISLVYDPEARTHDWIAIPWQTPDHHQVQTDLTLELSADGSGRGELQLTARGRAGSSIRRVARNPETFKQFMQVVTGSFFQDASSVDPTPVEVKDLEKPAVVRTRFETPNAARKEGDQLRLRLQSWSPREVFSLATRRYPLVLGTPNLQRWRYEIALPEGMQAARTPSSGEVNTDCIRMVRTVTPSATGLTVDQQLELRCERISAEAYPAYRAQMEQMNRFLDEELVVVPAKKPLLKPAKGLKSADAR